MSLNNLENDFLIPMLFGYSIIKGLDIIFDYT